MEDPSLSPRDRGLPWGQHFRATRGHTHYSSATCGGTTSPLPYPSTVVWTWFLGLLSGGVHSQRHGGSKAQSNSRFSISGPRTPCLRALTVNGLLLPGSVATRIETLPPRDRDIRGLPTVQKPFDEGGIEVLSCILAY